MFVKRLSKPSLIAATLALSLSHMAAVRADDGLPAAYSNNNRPVVNSNNQATAAQAQQSVAAGRAKDGLGSKVKGAFSATGDIFKESAKVTSNVIKGSVKATGEILAGSAKATGDVLVGSAKATEDILKGTAKAGEAACVATEDAIKGSAKTTGAAGAAPGKAVGAAGKPVSTTASRGSTTAGASADVTNGSAKTVENIPGAIGNPPGAVAVATEGALERHPKGTAPTPGAKAKANKITNIPYTPGATAATPMPEAIPFNREAQEPTTAAVPVQAKAQAKHQKQRLAKSMPGQDKPAVPVQTAPPQAGADDSLATRISPSSSERDESPSWNLQEPASSSSAFASQYALRTTPLPVTPDAIK